MAEQKVTTETYIKALKQTNFNKKAMSRKYVTNKNKLYTWCKENNRQYLLDEYDYKKY